MVPAAEGRRLESHRPTVNPSTRVGLLLLGHHFPTTHTRTGAWRDLINAAHEALLGAEDGAVGRRDRADLWWNIGVHDQKDEGTCTVS